MLHFLAGQAAGLGIGFVAGAFCPAVLRKIKSAFVTETKAAEQKVQNSVGAALKKL
jgi:hypothetical protein